MKFITNRDVENRVFSVNIKFEGFGNIDKGVSPEAEVEMFKDYGHPEIEIGGTFGADVFVLPQKKVRLDEGFFVEFAVTIDKMVGATEDEKIDEAKARCELFETVIKERIADAIGKVPVDMASSFVDGYPSEFIY